MKMLIRLFRSCGSVRTVLRNLRLNSYFSSAGGVTSKKGNVWCIKVPPVFKELTKEEVENLKIVPEGYKLIYHSKDLKTVALARVAVFFFTAVSIWLAVLIYTKPDIVLMKEELFSNEEVVLAFLIQAFIPYVYSTRHVYYIFRNGTSYKTVYYGLFGKLQTRVINHQAKELVQPNVNSYFPFFYKLKGKSLIVNLSGFTDRTEYAALVQYYESKD